MDRSVANLTTEQLYRKRAFDRANQRASRARKKSRISELEEEVADLKRRLVQSEDLVKRLQKNETALRDVISSACSSLQTIDAASTQPPIPSPPVSTPAATSVSDEFASTTQATASPSVNLDSALSPASALAPGLSPDSLAGSPSDGVRSLSLRDENTGLTLGLPLPTDFDNFWNESFPLDMTTTDAFSLSFMDLLNPIGDTWSPTDLEMPSLEDPKPIPQWERLPLHIGPMCRLDEVLLGLLESSRQHIQSSGPIAEFSQPAFPSIRSLLNPETQSEQSPISNAIGQHGRITMEIPSLPAKIGMMYNMCVLLRWLISPTKRNYEALPEYLRPLEIQLTVPHPIWIDVWAWPEAREQMIRHMDWSEFPLLRELANKANSINWPYGQSNIFSALSPTELRLNPVFENHIRQIKYWTLASTVSDRFPFMKCIPTAVIHEQHPNDEPEEVTV